MIYLRKVPNGTFCVANYTPAGTSEGPDIWADFMRYCLPFLLIYGIAGNALNCVVLRKLKSNSVFFLLAIVLCDLLFFFSNTPHTFDMLAGGEKSWPWFHHVFMRCSLVLLAVNNWISTASIWWIFSDWTRFSVNQKIGPLLAATVSQTYVGVGGGLVPLQAKTLTLQVYRLRLLAEVL